MCEEVRKCIREMFVCFPPELVVQMDSIILGGSFQLGKKVDRSVQTGRSRHDNN